MLASREAKDSQCGRATAAPPLQTWDKTRSRVGGFFGSRERYAVLSWWTSVDCKLPLPHRTRREAKPINQNIGSVEGFNLGKGGCFVQGGRAKIKRITHQAVSPNFGARNRRWDDSVKRLDLGQCAFSFCPRSYGLYDGPATEAPGPKPRQCELTHEIWAPLEGSGMGHHALRRTTIPSKRCRCRCQGMLFAKCAKREATKYKTDGRVVHMCHDSTMG